MIRALLVAAAAAAVNVGVVVAQGTGGDGSCTASEAYYPNGAFDPTLPTEGDNVPGFCIPCAEADAGCSACHFDENYNLVGGCGAP
jgi:hypothetical protein